MSFDAIAKSLDRAKAQYSAVVGIPADNRDVLKELALEIMRQFTALVEEAGGDASYIQPYEESLVDDLNYAFAGEIERAAEARLDHRFDIVRGANMLAAE